MSKDDFEKAFDNRSAQQKVVDATRKRGYRDPWTNEQFLARNILKMQEELGELLNVISHLPNDIYGRYICELGRQCKREFDNIDQWKTCHPSISGPNHLNLCQEAADLQVVLFNIADAIAEIAGEPFDVVQAAVEKSESDIKRGVR